MRVNIGPHTNWFGPYQLAEALCFWVKDEKDEFGMKHKPDWVHKFGEWLAHGSIEPEQKVGEVRSWNLDRKDTIISKLLNWIHSKKKRKMEIHIDRWDTWNMDSTLAPIILPMLKQLKEQKHGYPVCINNDDLPEHLRLKDDHSDSWSTQMELFEVESTINDGPSLGEQQWDWVMNEMINSFEKIVDDSWEDKYRNGEHDLQWKKLENGMSEMVNGPKDTYVCDYNGIAEEQKRISNGLRLFGTYYQNLWD